MSPFRRGREGERGAVLVIVALAILVLVGAAGLGIDAGRMFVERRVAQGAADQSSIAAAKARCGGATFAAAVTAGKAAAARNGYNDDQSTNWVNVTEPASGRFLTVIRSRISATLSGALGFQLFEVSAQTLAGCDAGQTGIGQTIYGGGNNCTGGKYAVNVNGSTSRVYGGVHANSDFAVSGGNNLFTNGPSAPADPVTYVGTIKSGSTSNGNVFEYPYPTQVPAPSPAWPAGWSPADATALLPAYLAIAQSQGSAHYKTSKIETLPEDGVYYTTSTDGIQVGSATGVRNVVLVAPNGPIVVSGANATFNPWDDPSLPRKGITMLTNKTNSGVAKCDSPTLEVSGGPNHWNGVIWAPGGLIKMSGSTNTTSAGSIIGWAIELNGSDLTIQFDGSWFPSTPGEVLIFE